MELVTVITRTSNRPIGFEKCHQSVRNQTYQNMRHLVSYDDEKDYEEYLKNYEDADLYFIDKKKFENYNDIPNPRTGPKFIYNLYFNDLFKEVTEGWVLILDDDDRLAHDNVIAQAMEKATYPTDMLLWQMQYPNGMKLPASMDFNKQPRLGRIGSPCIMVHSSIAKSIKWDGWKCGDFRYIHKCWKSTERKIWFKEPMILLGNQGGMGKKQDISVPKPISDVKITKPNLTKSPYTLKVNPEDAKKVRKAYVRKNTAKLRGIKGYKDVIISIPSYNRYDYITTILDNIFSQQTEKTYHIIVLDDNSNDSRYSKLKQAYQDKPFTYIKNKNNNGKKKYWETIQKLFKEAEKYKFKYMIQMDDDFKVSNNFIENIYSEFEKKGNQKTAALKYHKDKRDINNRKVWGLTHWIDGGTAFTYKFLQKINFKIDKIPSTRWLIDVNLSSGVWEQVSKKIRLYGFNVIKPEKSLVKHLDEKTSKMNPNARRRSNIKTENFIDE